MEQSCESWPKWTCLLTNFVDSSWSKRFQAHFHRTANDGCARVLRALFFVFVCLFVCFHNSKVGPKKTNIPRHFVILFEFYRIWKVLSLLMYNRLRYRMSETNRSLRNGSMKLMRMRWPRKKRWTRWRYLWTCRETSINSDGTFFFYRMLDSCVVFGCNNKSDPMILV